MSRNPEQWTPPLIAVVGIGTGPKTCALEGLQWIQRAEILVGGTRHLAFFADHPGEKMPLRGSMKSLVETVESLSRQRRVAVLASGDPLFFGIGRTLTSMLPADRLHFIPGPTSVQSLCAALARPWEDVRVFSLHGRESSLEWMWFLRQGYPVALLTDEEHGPPWIAQHLVRAGLDGFDLIVGEDLGLPSEKIRRMTPHDAVTADFSPLTVVLLGEPGLQDGPQKDSERCAPFKQEAPAEKTLEAVSGPDCNGPHKSAGAVALGVPDTAFVHRAGLITKREVRVLALSMLRLGPGQVLWDLGAGSGSMSVEAALLCPLHSVWAVEKVPERAEDIRKNVRRFHCGQVQVIEGEALHVVERLPAPHRVFVGGSGGTLPALLRAVWNRLAPLGRIVVAAVTWQSLQDVDTFSRSNGIALEALQVQVNRAVPVGSSVRFEALNPVFLCSMEKSGTVNV
ncbi:precorrin-6y C5,15-methyltransferase (decarboxylating) subunit CbiE [Desulfosoma caldarium]|uniref:Precorrin-6Y C5,15-methyltransferase (Decarboxylating) n=1 Tax=Desulfosoma caldarium TaxID=610254 RepID=A0A3N1UVB6_9BACT|nr:precorrin-6y C5,15-methyltransferase (decarboxylating) subunit CbiE [Desulfosoma caldarium]ROQ93369.1 precorrin-6Y C5,15-methyltransferase (decarboxylating) [Desulfosoma caldarium]